MASAVDAENTYFLGSEMISSFCCIHEYNILLNTTYSGYKNVKLNNVTQKIYKAYL